MTKLDDLRASEATYHAIFDLANDAIFMHDASTGAIVDVNRRMTEMYGYSRAEALALTVADLSAHEAPYTQERALELLHAAASGKPQVFEWLARHRSGRTFWVEVNLKHIVIEGRDRMLAIVRDITDRKRAEQSLREADERLREQASLVTLGEMAAVVAHEVKNPLAAIRGAIQIIGSRLPGESRDAAVLREVIARIDALDELMKDILLFARPPRPRPAQIDLVALARETMALVAQDPAARAVRFEIDGVIPPVAADRELLKIVLLNVLLNATHAVQSAGTVRASVGSTDTACRIVVADTGPGIAADVRDRIFMPFFTTKSKGTGLGLPTAKRIVEAHRGRIQVDCPAGGGTVVTIELPR